MVNFNGKLLSSAEPIIGYENRGLNYGDAVFETLRVSDEKIFFWEDHYFRMMASMRILRMEIPMNFTLEFLEDQIHQTIQTHADVSTESTTDNNSIRVKILIWRKTGGKYSPSTNDIEYLISCESIDSAHYVLNDSYYEVELFKDHYVLSGLLSTLKSNNKIINVLGSIYAKENDYHNCFLLNENKQIVEALNGNVFIVNGMTLKTPPLTDGCLNGILRKQIIVICENHPEYSIEEASVSPFELQKADEIFITNVIVGIQPISKYRKKEFASLISKDLLAKLNVKARLS